MAVRSFHKRAARSKGTEPRTHRRRKTLSKNAIAS
jgi:hypothetical protein